MHLTSVLRNAVEGARVARDGTHPLGWTHGWENVLGRHVLKLVRVSSLEAASKVLIAVAVSQGDKLLKDGRSNQDVFNHIFRVLCRAWSTSFPVASPIAVMQTLHNIVVPQGTMFSVYLAESRLRVSNVRCFGKVAPEDGAMQVEINITTRIDDQFAALSAQKMWPGGNMLPVPFKCIDELWSALDDLPLTKTVACASSRLNGGGGPVNTRSRTYIKAFHRQTFGGVLTVKNSEDDLEAEEWEFQRIFVVMQNRDVFGINRSEPPCDIIHDSREAKNTTRRAFGSSLLNCAEHKCFAH